jgi:hypothetical protein
VRLSHGNRNAFRFSVVKLRWKPRRPCWHEYQGASRGLEGPLRGLASFSPCMGISLLFGRPNRRTAVVPMVSLRVLCRPSSGHPAAAASVYPTAAAAGELLVLLPESTGLLSLCQDLPRRVDEGGSTASSAQTVKNPVLLHRPSSSVHPPQWLCYGGGMLRRTGEQGREPFLDKGGQGK